MTAIALAGVCAVAPYLGPSGARAVSPGGNGKIVAAKSDGDFEVNLWVQDLDGSGRVKVTDGHFDFDPTWSPDGTKIAFARGSLDGVQIWTINANGSGLDQVTNFPVESRYPSFSPDGSRIVYQGSYAEDGTDIFRIDIDGTDRQQLTFDSAAYHPVWSPSGSLIAYSSNGRPQTMSPSGTHVHEFTVSNCEPADWSPDQLRIACHQFGDGTWAEVELIRADDEIGTIFLTDDDEMAAEYRTRASYSPDGKLVIFEAASAFSSGVQLYIEPANGSAAPVALWLGEGFADADWQPNPPMRYADILSSSFRDDINWLAMTGITTGCAPMRFCPTGNVTREQMASFLVRALDLPSTATDYFSDDETSSHETNINRLAAAGITTGCAVGKFCPIGNVTRAEMASFLVRALNLPSTATDYFSDDETSSHETNINRLAAAGITTGCAVGKFCPSGLVTREQMAAFLHRALE